MDVGSITLKNLSCSDFLPFSKYNLFSFGDVMQSNVDWEGRGAIGGNATFIDFEVGAGIIPKPDRSTDDTLVIAGNLAWTNGVNDAGNTVMTPVGNYQVTNVRYTNTSLQQPVRKTPLPIDFNAAYDYAKCLSSDLSNMSSDGDTLILNCFGDIRLIGNSPTLNIFNIDPSKIASDENIFGGANTNNRLDNINGLTIVVPEDSTTIINISGTSIKFGDYSILRNTNVPNPFPTSSESVCNIIGEGSAPTSEEKRKILWNFYGENPTIIMSTISLSGSILAPDGNLKAFDGNIEGNVIINTFMPFENNTSYHTELHEFPFNGCIPSTDCSSQSQSISQSISESISQSISHSVSESISHSISQSVSASISHSISQSVSASISHSITSYPCCSCIKGTVWWDCNCNNMYDCNEEGASHIVVKLYDVNGICVRETITNRCGSYCLTHICPGQYTITFYNSNSYYEDCYYSKCVTLFSSDCLLVINVAL